MHYLDLTLPTLAANLALDEALLLQAETGGPELLRVWEWQTPAVVLGAGGRMVEDVDEVACERDGVPLGRRASGGGTVLLDAGCLLFTLVASYDRHPALGEINSSYRYILGLTEKALADLTPEITHMGSSDLASAGRKFSGNAQHRKRRCLLHHGTLLYAFDIVQIARYLKMPQRQPDYRATRSHREFLMNLPTTAAELTRRLRALWEAREDLTDWPRENVEKLVIEKFASEDWLRRR